MPIALSLIHIYRKRGGVCSTYMADRLQPGHTARVFVHTNKNFRLPEDGDTPIIMVGPVSYTHLFPCYSVIKKWRTGRDSNPRYCCQYTHFPGVLIRP